MKAKDAKVPVTNPLHGKFDQMVDAVLGAPPKAPQKIRPKVEAWAIPLKNIYDNEAVRLDASHYDKATALALQELRRCKCALEPLSQVATITLPNQFVRIWAESADYGLPYVNASDLMGLAGLETLGENTRFLSRETDTDIGSLIIHKGWLVVSCSGTIGRVFYIPDRMDGWAATHDLIRVIPDKGLPVGYLHAYLSSPLAQAQILGHTHGGQIDHITDQQIGSILVPRLADEKVTEIHEETMKALLKREEAIASLSAIAADLRASLKK